MTRAPFASVLLALAGAVGCTASGEDSKSSSPQPVAVRSGIDPSAWGRLLATYVDERGLVNYGAWKASAQDRGKLREYLQQLAVPAQPPARGKDLAATLMNAYNASTIAWILDHYPTESIRSLDHSFDGERHPIGGQRVSLDQIEHGTLRPQIGFRVHAVLVCAARSCPPLARQAYRAETLDAQLDDAMRRWLAREDLNRFLPAEDRVEISMIFRWYSEDFQKAPWALPGVLAAFAPDRFREFAGRGGYKIDHKPYDWGLNDQGPHGRNYGGIRELLDKIRE